MKRLSLVAVLVALALGLTAEAQTKKRKAKAKPAAEMSEDAEAEEQAPRKRRKSMHDEVSGQGYGLAGCGLGSIAFGPKPGIIQVVAATLNGTAGSQTFGITTGTSNCDIPSMGHQAAVFIEVNKEIVRKEAARGEGETVLNLSQIFECGDTDRFGQQIQQNYQDIFGQDQSSYESTRQIIKTIKSDAVLASSCAQLG